jgi:signal transduction histidine kinase
MYVCEVGGTLVCMVAVTALSKIVPWRRPADALLDGAIAVAALSSSLAGIAHGGVGPLEAETRNLDLAGISLAAASTLPLVVWRRFPLGVFALTAGAGVALAGAGYRLDLLIGPAAALYLLAASREPESPWTRRSTALVAVAFGAYLLAAAVAQAGFPSSVLLHTGFAWAVAWFAGERTRLRREQNADLRAHALRAEREAESERRVAIAEERARSARDLHDSAGHAMIVIAVRAGAARLRHADDPDRSLRALEAIEEVARETAADVDAIVGGLRDKAAGARLVEAPHGLASLDTLLAGHRDAGLELRCVTSGEPRALAPATDQAAYRILQEALTNAARHGSGDARVELAFGQAGLELTVTNRVTGDARPPAAGGHGLIGMTERATLLGGSLSAEPLNGVFRLRARLPYRGRPS